MVSFLLPEGFVDLFKQVSTDNATKYHYEEHKKNQGGDDAGKLMRRVNDCQYRSREPECDMVPQVGLLELVFEKSFFYRVNQGQAD